MISPRLLIHTAIYQEIGAEDRNGNPTFDEEKTLENVRFVPVLATAKDSQGETANDRLTMFYCPFVSSPQIVPQKLARVTWNGEQYTIRSVTPCYTMGGESVHHYEAALV